MGAADRARSRHTSLYARPGRLGLRKTQPACLQPRPLTGTVRRFTIPDTEMLWLPHARGSYPWNRSRLPAAVVHRAASIVRPWRSSEHPDLGILGRLIAFEEQSMMKVVAPESPVDEGQRIIVFSDLSGGDGGDGHQLGKRPGENGPRS
jgi:hypothetical protein